jgi:hypothetical protein
MLEMMASGGTPQGALRASVLNPSPGIKSFPSEMKEIWWRAWEAKNFQTRFGNPAGREIVAGQFKSNSSVAKIKADLRNHLVLPGTYKPELN